jgi:ribosomal-protein-alanine N-acetyltransferase
MIGYALFGADSKAQMRLISVAVLPEHRGRGVAARLIQRGLETLEGQKIASCMLDVRVGNERAIRIYERLGFRKLSIFPGYYANKEDAWSMKWEPCVSTEESAATSGSGHLPPPPVA